MAAQRAWAFPDSLQPSPDEAGFDLEAALDSVVLLRAEIPEDAFTAQILGTARTPPISVRDSAWYSRSAPAGCARSSAHLHPASTRIQA